METDEGIYGLGDADNLAMGRTMFEAITHLGRLIVGEDPLSTERLWQLMFRTAFYPGDRTICSAISGIDTALCFAVPNVAMGDATPGSSTLLWDIFPVQPTFEGGYIRRSEAPGLGIEFNEEAAQSYSYEPYLLPQFRIRDGSYYNW